MITVQTIIQCPAMLLQTFQALLDSMTPEQMAVKRRHLQQLLLLKPCYLPVAASRTPGAVFATHSLCSRKVPTLLQLNRRLRNNSSQLDCRTSLNCNQNLLKPWFRPADSLECDSCCQETNCFRLIRTYSWDKLQDLTENVQVNRFLERLKGCTTDTKQRHDLANVAHMSHEKPACLFALRIPIFGFHALNCNIYIFSCGQFHKGLGLINQATQIPGHQTTASHVKYQANRTQTTCLLAEHPQ